jgi:hypothetical protein
MYSVDKLAISRHRVKRISETQLRGLKVVRLATITKNQSNINTDRQLTVYTTFLIIKTLTVGGLVGNPWPSQINTQLNQNGHQQW